MRTPLTDFSDDFCRSLHGLVGPFDGTLAEVSQGVGAELGQVVLDDLRGIRGRLDVLLGQVETRRAYVLIFGPLKSGRSTLMNALAGTYVSEVTSLPDYPAAVLVSHAEQPAYGITRFDGSSEPFDNADVLRAVVDSAHAQLAEAVREAERRGRAFDPRSDLPHAIRRIDVRIPAGELAPSEAVLVATPGFRSPLGFRYDASTQDFRHAASVPVFVVKPDSLFLGQVQEELADLLDHYGRVFVVLNVDSSRMDLGPQGELSPSLEQTDPERIVDSFEGLSMSARLRQAADEGRLSIHSVDLLRAAAERMRARGGDETVGGDRTEHALRFDGFLADLTDHLDANDDLNAFVGDSLTRGGVLLDELEGVCAHTGFRRFVVRLKELVGLRDEQNARLNAARELREVDWEHAVLDRPADAAQASARTNMVLAKLGEQVDRALDSWFRSPASLQALLDKILLPQAAAARRHMRQYVLEDLRERIEQGDGPGADASTAATRERCGLDLRAIARATLREVASRPVEGPPDEAPIQTEEIPVRRRLADWLLFQSKQNVRRRVFGAPTQPSARIDPTHKARVLGETGRESMRAIIGRHHEEHLRGVLMGLERALVKAFATGVAERVEAVLRREIGQLEPELAGVDAEVQARRGLAASHEALRSALAESRAGLQALRSRVTPTLRDVEIAPVSPFTSDEMADEPPVDPGVDAEPIDDGASVGAEGERGQGA